MSPRRSYDDLVRQRLLYFWQRRDEHGAPLGCVTTTYTFDAPFFEEQCLARFVGMDTDATESPLAYVLEREEKLSQIFSCVFVDGRHVAAQRSLRWHLLPIKAPGGACQHAKVSLLVWEHLIRVLISSANLTKFGYRRNFEYAGVLEFTRAGELPLSLLREVVGFLERVATFGPRSDDAATEATPGLRAFLERVRTHTASWTEVSWSRGAPSAEFLPVFPGGPPLFEQIQSRVWKGTGPSSAWILSPFFGADEEARRPVDALVEVMGQQGERDLHFQVPGRRHPDGTIELDVPETLRRGWGNRRNHHFHLVAPVDEDGEPRTLHAKGLWLVRDDRAASMVGSSNFTTAGTGAGPGPSNIEANLAHSFPSLKDPIARATEACSPPCDEIDLDAQEVRFLPAPDQETPEAEALVPLPSGFGMALFRPGGGMGTLLLSVGPDLQFSFKVRADDGTELSDSHLWKEAGSPSKIEIPWTHHRPPTSLLVEWTDKNGETRSSLWIVNVTDFSKLPPPEEMRTLPLEVLLEILTSARPLHESLPAALRKAAQRTGRNPLLELDPHRKVDTSEFLLRRVGRVSAALEGLRERLEQPAFNVDALRWRLRGPVGPIVLARQLAEREGDAASFMIAEVALTLRHVNWSAAEVQVGSAVVRDELARILAELEALAAACPAPPNLADYVRASFGRVVEGPGT